MTQIGTAYIKVAADTDGIKRDLDKSKGSILGWGKSLGALGAAAGAAVVVGDFLKDSVEAAQESEKVQANLERQVEATGGSYEKYQEQIESTITATSNLAAVDDEELAESFTKLQGSTGDVETALKGMEAATDLAAARNISLGSATKQIEKALSGGTAGLKKYGIQLKKGASDTEVLNSLQKKFGGAAEAYGKTAAGSQERFGIALENVKEQVGTALLPLLEKFFTYASKALTDFQKYWPQISDGIKTAVKIAQPFLEYLGVIIKNVAEQVANIARLIAAIARGDWAAAWDAIKLIVVQAITGMVEIIKANPIAQAIGALLEKAKQALDNAIAGLKAAAARIGNAIIDAIVAPFAFVGDKVRDAIRAYLTFAAAFYEAIGDRAAAIGRAIVSNITGAVTGIGDAVRGAINAAITFGAELVGAIGRRAGAIGSAILSNVVGAIGAIGEAVRGAINTAIEFGKDWVAGIAARGKAIGTGIKDAIVNGVSGLAGALFAALRRAIDWAWDKAKRLYNSTVGRIPGAPDLPGGRSAAAPAAAAGPAAAGTGVAGYAAPAGLGTMGAAGASTRALRLPGISRLTPTAEQRPLEVRVYIGDQELRGIVRTEVAYTDDATARILLAGAR